MTALSWGIETVERGWIPDALTRPVMRRLCSIFLRQAKRLDDGKAAVRDADFLAMLRAEPIAATPEKANQQHYELPAEFFAHVLGPRRKYSCGLWPEESTTLAESEEAALRETCQRAELVDGQSILELGCGWGSLTLWLCEHYPHSQIVAVSNSQPQRLFIEDAARRYTNLRVITADMNTFSPQDFFGSMQFDRIVSVEMFEHMRNYERLLERIASWLAPNGKLFVHHFCHRQLAYPFETDGDVNWMGRYFFTGGIMPNERLLDDFPRELRVAQRWSWNGRHYQRTADAWLANLDAKRADVVPILAQTYGVRDAERWFQRWRMFFLAVSELFGYANGNEWFIAHALLEHQPQPAPRLGS